MDGKERSSSTASNGSAEDGRKLSVESNNASVEYGSARASDMKDAARLESDLRKNDEPEKKRVFRPFLFGSLEEAMNDQVTVDDLDKGGRILAKIGLGNIFSRPVKQPKQGEALKDIQLQVPFTKKFLNEIHKDGQPARKTNEVITSKYTLLTFVPMASMMQFRRFTNAFYLGIAILAMAGYYGNNLWIVSFNPVTIIILLVVVIGFALILEGKDDINRHQRDIKTNNQEISRIRNGQIEETCWGDLLPGDLIFVNDREAVPADIILLCSYGADKKGSTCYIETSGIDGETNLKVKQVPQYMTRNVLGNDSVRSSMLLARGSNAQLIRQGSTLENLNATKSMVASFVSTVSAGTYEYEQPNVFLQFNASFVPYTSADGSDRQAIDFKNLVLRGSMLRNTKWIIGLVVYAGPETKLALSKRETPAKLGRIDYFLNTMLLGVFALYLIIVFLADILLFTNATDTSKWWYFKYTSSTTSFNVVGPVAYFFTFAILFANIVPIPILICVEVMNFYAQQIMQQDLDLYHEETDTPAVCQAGNLVAEIGQVSHIFSDKTGTLTRNMMKMVGCYVGDKMYGFIPPKVDTSLDDDMYSQSDSASQISGTTSLPTVVQVDNIDLQSSKDGDFAMDGINGFQSASSEKIAINIDPSESHGSEQPDSMQSIKVDEVFSNVITMFESGEANDEKARLLKFFRLLAVCHTVVLDYDENGEPTLNAESPDEEAFVKAAITVGIDLESTADGVVKIKTPNGPRSYKVLALNPFNSTRKRMSLVVNCLDCNSIYLMMKGADNVMIERLAPGQEDTVNKLKDALEQYSWNGLRTLVMGMRKLEQKEFVEWEKEYKRALTAPSKERGALIAKAAEKIESNIEFIGASAIEDQLQLGVPNAIKTLREAGIQVWVLTGDKIETAINIGLSSNLLDAEMLQLKLISEDPTELEDQLDQILNVVDSAIKHKPVERTNNQTKADVMCKLHDNIEVLSQVSEQEKSFLWKYFDRFYHWLFRLDVNEELQANVALIVSGLSLEYLLAEQKGSPQIEAKLLKVARFCKVVLACRVSPAQKSLIVEMVRYAPDNKHRARDPVTLAIGDGANDVPMIQAAHVGIGISGQEGRQAVNSADFAIAQFRFLVKMMLVHGRWNYRRQANVIVFVTYSWLLYTFLLFIYLPYSLYSGQQIYYFTGYTSVFAYFANVVICAHGWFDRDISAETALRNPWTYYVGLQGKDLNTKKLVQLTLRSIAHLLLIWGFIFNVTPVGVSIEVLGTAIYLGLVLVLYLLTLLYGTTFTSITILVFVFDVALFLIFMAVATSPPILYSPLIGATVWSGVFLSLVAVVLIEMTIRYVHKEFFPNPLDLLIEQDRGYYKGEKHARAAHQDAIKIIEEFGKLTVMPLNIGAKQIKRLVDTHDKEKKASMATMVEESIPGSTPSVESPRPSHGAQLFGSKAFSQTFQRLKPLFDLDMPDFGVSKRKKNSSADDEEAGTDDVDDIASNRTLSLDEVGDDDPDVGSLFSAATRLDLQNYIPRMEAIEENESEGEMERESSTDLLRSSSEK